MNKSNNVHARIQEFLSGGGGGGGGVEARRPENSLDNGFLVINLFYSLQSGSNGFITERRRGSNFFQGVGVSKETHITCDFPGILWIRTWGRLTPLFAYRIMVYQILNKTEKCHPTTTKRKKLSPAGRDSKCGSRGGQGVWTPLENHKLYGFLWGISNWTPLEKVGPTPWKMLDPLWNLEK